MAAKDIYKIDNYFITIGTIFLILSLLTIFADPRTYNDITITSDNLLEFEDWDGRTLEDIKEQYGEQTEVFVSEYPLIRTIIGVNGFVLLAIGMSYRSRERKIISIWDALERSGEARVPELAMALGLPREFILRHLKDINAQQNAYYVWDSEKDKIADGKLMAEYMFTAACPSCGHSISQKIKLNFSSPPKCAYCGTSASVDDLNKLKRDVIESRFAPKPAVAQGNFSVGVFVLLLLFFWPGAIFYLVTKKSKALEGAFSPVQPS